MPFGHAEKERHSSISVKNNKKKGSTFPISIQNVKVLNILKTTKVMNEDKDNYSYTTDITRYIIPCYHITSQYGQAEKH